jgi:hypothetical protein
VNVPLVCYLVKLYVKVHEIEDQYPNFNKTGDENKRRDYIIQREKTGS